MSLRVYCGEFLTSPVPLHMDMNWCSHACFYCFANLNKPSRRFDAGFLRPLVMALSRAEGENPTHEQWLARRGYPVLASNTVDPFAAGNWRQFLEVHDALSPLGMRFTYQTKGGEAEAVERALSDPPTMWYVSLTSDNESLLKRNEPGAPSHRARLDLIAEAKRRGHHVVAGVNPMVPDWWHDTDALIDDLHSAGVRHAWVQPLHLSRFQVAAMPSSTQSKQAKIIAYGMKKMPPDAPVIDAFQRDCRAAGIAVFGDADSPHHFWDAYFDLGFPFWPTLTGWFAHLEQVGGGLPVEFEQADFARWCDVGLPSPRASFKEFVQPFARSVRNLAERDGETWRDPHHKCKSMADVIAAQWLVFDYPTKLRHPCIATAAEFKGGEPVAVFDDEFGNDILVYVPGGTEGALFDVSASRTARYWDSAEEGKQKWQALAGCGHAPEAEQDTSPKRAIAGKAPSLASAVAGNAAAAGQ